MNPHLSSQDIMGWMVGERTSDVLKHVEACSECKAKVAEESEALLYFRGGVRAWSDSELSVRRTGDWRAAAQSRIRFRNACLAFAMCLIAFVAVFSRPSQPPLGERTVTDAALLKQVNSELSQDVPSPMEPLMKLVTWDGAERSQGMQR